MKPSNINKTILILTLVLFIISCGSGEQQSTLGENFRQGHQGLEINYVLPVISPYENTEHTIEIKLSNLGATHITEGEITLSGYKKQYLEIIGEPVKFIVPEGWDQLRGKSPESPKGEIYPKNMKFYAKVKQIPVGLTQQRENLRITANYNYQLVLVYDACIGARKYDVATFGCQIPKKPVPFQGQGSPLAITEMVQLPYEETMDFIFTLENKGMGEVTQALLTKAELGGVPLNCDRQYFDFPEKRYSSSLREQEKILICKAEVKNRGVNIEDPLLLVFDFNYVETQDHPFTIQSRDQTLARGGLFV